MGCRVFETPHLRAGRHDAMDALEIEYKPKLTRGHMHYNRILYICTGMQAGRSRNVEPEESAPRETMQIKSTIESSISLRIALILSILAGSFLHVARGQSLKVVTMNIWSGLDYIGQSRMGEYETVEVRESRFRILLEGLKTTRPDVIALQEANPVSEQARTLARELGYDFICQRVNSGVKFLDVGWPGNLNEGTAILARKELNLKLADVWELGDGFGLFGNLLSLHWNEQRIALVGKIMIGRTEVFVVNVHISSAVPDDSVSRAVARSIALARLQNKSEVDAAVAACFADADSRGVSVKVLLENLERYCAGKPVILLGDFNAEPDRPEIKQLIREGKFIDAAEASRAGSLSTWDPELNSNIRYSTQPTDSRGDTLEVEGLLSAWFDAKPRRIDYLFLNDRWKRDQVKDTKLFLDQPVDGLHASDHFGLCTVLDASQIGTACRMSAIAGESEIEGFPILSYDTDVGFGYGAKGFFLNLLGHRESFDVTLFNSTKGERWYRFVFSMPDFELRQGTEYPFSFDLVIDYDKYLKMNFYGLGKNSRWEDGETYTREPLEVSGVVSRGISRELVLQAGVKYKTVRNLNLRPDGLFTRTGKPVDFSRSRALTLYTDVRYDSRDSYVNPSRGFVAELELESGGSRLLGDYSLSAATFSVQSYFVLFYPKSVLAARIWGRTVRGTNLPMHALVAVGGNRTLRGSPQDRFLDMTAAVVNVELRFPVFWRFGGVLGLDAGQVAGAPGALTIGGWESNLVAGLRFYMDTFTVRADLGFGKETTGFYLNFGQLF